MSSQNINLELDQNQSADELEELSSHQEVIETVISSLDQHDTAMVNHADDGTIWKFQYGSVEVFVQLTGETDDDLLTVWAKVLKLPAQDEPGLMRQLLEMNWSGTFETCFSIYDNQVVVCGQRTIGGLFAKIQSIINTS